MLSRSDSITEENTPLVKCLKRFFRLIGLKVANRPYMFIVLPLITCVICSSSILTTKMTNDITDFTPKQARARKELRVYKNFFGYKGDPVVIFVFVSAKDGGSMLGVPQLSETVRLLDSILNDVQIKDKLTSKRLTFSQVCSNFCDINEPVRIIYNSMTINEQYNDSSALIDLTFPIATILGQQFFVDNNFFGVQVDERDNLVDARLVLLHFRAQFRGRAGDKTAERYETEVTNFILNNFTSDFINVYTMSSTFVTAEIVRTGRSLLPFIIIGFTIMCIFSTITATSSSMLAAQFDYFKIIVAIAACVSPLLACGTALGFLILCGLRFGSILCATPFLVLAIGVDDAFLMMNSWQKLCQNYRKHRASKYLEKSENEIISNRMSAMLQEVGPSITITTLTNVLAFGIGALSSPPEIQIFCIGNATAMIFDFIYQLTLFAAIMAAVGRRELRSEQLRSSSKLNKWLIKHQNNIIILERIVKRYCSTLCRRTFAIITIISLFFYWSLSIYGIYRMKVELKPEKLFIQDSNLLKLLQLRDQYIMPYYAPTLVFVGRPGNLEKPENIRTLHQIVEDFEALPSSIGPKATKFWLRDYEDFFEIAFDGVNDKWNLTRTIGIKEHDLQNFLEWPEFHHWNGFMQFDIDKHGKKYLKSYFFLLLSHGDLTKWSSRAKLLGHLRNIADRYAHYEVSVYDDDAKFLDIIEILLTQTILSSGCTLFCMMIVCFLFIPQFCAVIIATFSIFSIFLGVFGTLSLWDVDLDPIVMSAMIMSIGFSVDIPAHVTYHFFRANGETAEARLLHCFVAIAFPVLQAAISTLLCVLSLLFTNLHMAHVFVKTMTLVVTIGLIHGLLIMPVLFSVTFGLRLIRRKKVFEITTTSSPKVATISDDVTVTLGLGTKFQVPTH